MTICATELLEPAPNTPSFMAGYGSKVIAVRQNMVPSGSFADRPNGTYLGYEHFDEHGEVVWRLVGCHH